ncbi:MAG: hypothetical protein IKR40_12010 [Treponema sp.]|nr:hypothetical protein [Treponema sp.]
MNDYIIEGIVSEIESMNSNEVLFKLSGIEGYALKVGEKKYNIICTEKLIKNSKLKHEKEPDFKFYEHSFIISKNIQFAVTDTAKLFLIKSNALGKHVKITIAGDYSSIKINLEKKENIPVSSIILFAD